MSLSESITMIESKQLYRLQEQGIQWAILYHYDSLVYTTIEKAVVTMETLVEARFFGANKEIRIYREKGSYKEVIREQKPKDHMIEEEYLLMKHAGFRRIKVKKYLGYDEDGQAYIEYVQPCGLV